MAEASDRDIAAMEQVATCGYIPIERRGAGSFGYVYAVDDEHGQIQAFKYMIPHTDYSQMGLPSLIEIDCLRRIEHPYVLHASHIITPQTCNIRGLAIVMPLADSTLYDFMMMPHITAEFKLPAFYKLACALDFLHSHGILHLDIKADNVVIKDFDNPHPYFIDFGLSLEVDDARVGIQAKQLRLTKDHRAPELLIQKSPYTYTAAADIWSFGIMMVYMFSTEAIYIHVKDGKTQAVNLREISVTDLHGLVLSIFADTAFITHATRNVSAEYRDACIDVISRMLQIEPQKRITAAELVAHRVFDKFRVHVPGTMLKPRVHHDYAGGHRDIMKLIIHWCRTIYANERAELLFLAVDLFKRMDSYYHKHTHAQRMMLAATCLWMASKILTPDTYLKVQDFASRTKDIVDDITAPKVLEIETEIVAVLTGILNVNELYRWCANGAELKYSFDHIIMDADATLYARADIPAWVAVIRAVISPEQAQRAKTISCAELMS